MVVRSWYEFSTTCLTKQDEEVKAATTWNPSSKESSGSDGLITLIDNTTLTVHQSDTDLLS